MKVVFLDIDGVLNGHYFMKEAESCNILHPCVLRLNWIIRETGAKVVLSSAWRYMVHGKSMNLMGFAYMLRTHGFRGLDTVLIDLTDPDETCQQCRHHHKRGKGQLWDGKAFACSKCGAEVGNRGRQIAFWLERHPDVTRHVVLDDEDHGFGPHGLATVITDGAQGLSDANAKKAISILNKKGGRRWRPTSSR